MFSMTFFNWSNETDSPNVSKWLWIYVLITVFFTALTIGLWYYIVIFRPARQGKRVDEENWKEKPSRSKRILPKLEETFRNIIPNLVHPILKR